MTDYKKEHRGLLTHINSGDYHFKGNEAGTVQALLLAGFLTRDGAARSTDTALLTLELTAAGHRYLAGLWDRPSH